jgi:hypothetical protein
MHIVASETTLTEERPTVPDLPSGEWIVRFDRVEGLVGFAIDALAAERPNVDQALEALHLAEVLAKGRSQDRMRRSQRGQGGAR